MMALSSLLCIPALLAGLENTIEFESSHGPIENPLEKERATPLAVMFSSEWPIPFTLLVRSGIPSSEI